MNRKIKSLLVSILAVFALSTHGLSQRIAYVDLNEVLSSMDDYNQAQEELDAIAEKWRQEINQDYDKIKGLYNKYQAEQVLLSDEAKSKQENEIMDLEKKVRDMQRKRFGPEGDLFRKREELVTPIQEKIFDAVEDYASERGYDFIFDKNSATGMLFGNPRFDKTSDLINRLKE